MATQDILKIKCVEKLVNQHKNKKTPQNDNLTCRFGAFFVIINEFYCHSKKPFKSNFATCGRQGLCCLVLYALSRQMRVIYLS